MNYIPIQKDIDIGINDLIVFISSGSNNSSEPLIPRALQKIAEFFEADFAILLNLSAERTKKPITHASVRARRPLPDPDVIVCLLPWTMARVRQGHPVSIRAVEKLDVDTDRNGCIKAGFSAYLCVPLWEGGKVRAAMLLAMTDGKRRWSESDSSGLQLLGQLLVDALFRSRDEDNLKKVELGYRTALEIAQAESEKSRNFLKSVLASLQEQVVVIDRQGEILAVNKQWLRFALENDLENLENILPGANYLEACQKAAEKGNPEVEVALTGIQEVLAGQRSHFESEYECSSRQTKRWFSMSATPLNRPEGGAVITHSEITRLRVSEEQALRQKEKLDEAQRLAHMGSWEWDVEPDLVAFSEEGARIYGVEPQVELPGKSLLAMICPEDRKSVHLAMDRALADPGGVYHVDYRIFRADGSERIIRLHGIAVRDPTGPSVRMMGTCLDITEQRLAEIESRRLRAELAHRDRLDIQSYLTGIIAHEISQPLAAILSHAQAAIRFLRAEEPCLEEVAEALEDIVACDKRAAEVISRLRAMSRRDEGKREPLNLNELIDQVLSLIQSKLMARKIGVRKHFSPNLPFLTGDSIQIQQVVLNLLLNALEALKTQPPEKRLVEISTAAIGDDAIVAGFRDTGPGLSSEIMETIFDPFFTTRPKGTGMGLAISRSIIEAHGGRLWAEAHPEGGTLFSFQLPAQSEGTESGQA
jgi:PAS domain S-box-containing protein